MLGVDRHVGGTVGGHAGDRRSPDRQSCRRALGLRVDRRGVEAVSGGHGDDVGAVRCAEQLLEALGRAAPRPAGGTRRCRRRRCRRRRCGDPRPGRAGPSARRRRGGRRCRRRGRRSSSRRGRRRGRWRPRRRCRWRRGLHGRPPPARRTTRGHAPASTRRRRGGRRREAVRRPCGRRQAPTARLRWPGSRRSPCSA